MKTTFCKNSAQRSRWAVSLCFTSATLLGLEALHPGSCAWMGFDNEQSFALSASMATLSIFLATFILTRLVSAHGAGERE